MNINLLREIGIALIFVLLQVLVFNQIHLFGVAVPLVFIYVMFSNICSGRCIIISRQQIFTIYRYIFNCYNKNNERDCIIGYAFIR